MYKERKVFCNFHLCEYDSSTFFYYFVNLTLAACKESFGLLFFCSYLPKTNIFRDICAVFMPFRKTRPSVLQSAKVFTYQGSYFLLISESRVINAADKMCEKFSAHLLLFSLLPSKLAQGSKYSPSLFGWFLWLPSVVTFSCQSVRNYKVEGFCL